MTNHDHTGTAGRSISLEHLLRYMGLRPSTQELQRIFTHQSLDPDSNNCRLIFLACMPLRAR